MFHQCQINPAVNFRLLLEECQLETFRQCQCQVSRSVSCLFPPGECQMELFRQCQCQRQVSRSVSCHHHHHCLVVFPLKAHGRKTSLVSPRKKLGTLTLNSSRH